VTKLSYQHLYPVLAGAGNARIYAGKSGACRKSLAVTSAVRDGCLGF
jgi:hypothetical protein